MLGKSIGGPRGFRPRRHRWPVAALWQRSGPGRRRAPETAASCQCIRPSRLSLFVATHQCVGFRLNLNSQGPFQPNVTSFEWQPIQSRDVVSETRGIPWHRGFPPEPYDGPYLTTFRPTEKPDASTAPIRGLDPTRSSRLSLAPSSSLAASLSLLCQG